MRHFASPAFWEAVRQASRKRPRTRRQELRAAQGKPAASVITFKKVGRLWSVRVGLQYRALAAEVGVDLVWLWFGSHRDYDRLIG